MVVALQLVLVSLVELVSEQLILVLVVVVGYLVVVLQLVLVLVAAWVPFEFQY